MVPSDRGGACVVGPAGLTGRLGGAGSGTPFCNATDEPARVLEIISPAGFEKFFDAMTDMAARGELSPATMSALAGQYGARVDPSSVPSLCPRTG